VDEGTTPPQKLVLRTVRAENTKLVKTPSCFLCLLWLNKICVNLRNLWLFLCLRVFVANFVFCPLLIYSQSQEVQKKCSKTVNFLQFLLKTRSFLTKKCKKVQIYAHFYPHFLPKNE